MQFKIAIPDQIKWKVELGTGVEESEVEIELKW